MAMATTGQRDGRLYSSVWLMLALLTLLPGCARAFAIRSHGVQPRPPSARAPSDEAPASRCDTADTTGDDVSVESYRHGDFTLTYLYKRAAPGREGDRPVVLIHPVGIGLSSWFWEKAMRSYEDSPAMYAPDLIGCGIDHGSDAWRPEERGLFFPLSWVEGVETLMNEVIVPKMREGRRRSSPLSILFGDGRNDVRCGGGCLVIAQGGLAPVGISLASRNPLLVENLMLTSPPTYEDVTTAIPEPELRRNYDYLRSPIFGGLAFAALESRGVIEFFSNLFLFRDACDERWLDEAQRESCAEARTPVQAFNAGLLQHRSFEGDLKEMSQPLMVVSGEADKRVSGRRLYESELNQCELRTIEGCNVLPWENPTGVVELIKELGY